MTLEAALKQQGIDPNTLSDNTKAQLENVLLQKGKEVLALLLQILLADGRQLNRTSDAELQQRLEDAKVQAEAEAKAQADQKKRRNIIVAIAVGVTVIIGTTIYLFTRKK